MIKQNVKRGSQLKNRRKWRRRRNGSMKRNMKKWKKSRGVEQEEEDRGGQMKKEEESFFSSSLPLTALQALRAARWDPNS